MRCKQCGEEKADEAFRLYYNGSGRSYKTCKTCERINSRRKYLERINPDADELQDIYDLYDKQRDAGLKPPTQRRKTSTKAVKRQMKALTEVPVELQEWLDKDLTDTHPDDNDEVYERLRDKYAPVVSFDMILALPIRDKRHSDTLDKILERFNAHEQHFWAREEEEFE